MRGLQVPLAFLLLGPIGLQAQEPIPVTLHTGICATIDNSEFCAQAIDEHQLPLSHGLVRRQGRVLEVRLANGQVRTVAPDTTPDWPSEPYYLGTITSIGYHLLWVQQCEGSSIQLVNVRTGWSVLLDAMPILSPDRKRFATAGMNIERYNPERLQVWLFDQDTVRREWGLTPDDDWVPDSLHWIAPTAFTFRRAPMLAQILGGPPGIPDTARFEVHRGWVTSRP